MRRPLAVVPPVRMPYDLRGVGRALRDEFGGDGEGVRAALRARLCALYASDRATLVDSGTSALALAFRAVGAGATVAAPAYACPDLITAAQLAGVRLRLYDVVPETLAPDLASVTSALDAGAAAVLVVPLFGYPIDLTAVRTLAQRVGALVIEDAAQGAGGAIGGRLVGAAGDLAVLSFGRGKGIGGGGGGALLDRRRAGATTEAGDATRLALPDARAGVGAVTTAVVQLPLSSRWLFAVPSSIPALRLGEAVYHAPGAVAGMTAFAASLALRSLAQLSHDVRRRAGTAERISASLRAAAVATVRATGEPGWLRLAALVDPAARDRAYRYGVRVPYPRPLHAYPEGRDVVLPPPADLSGTERLVRSLVTVPVHDHLTPRDVERLTALLASA